MENYSYSHILGNTMASNNIDDQEDSKYEEHNTPILNRSIYSQENSESYISSDNEREK